MDACWLGQRPDTKRLSVIIRLWLRNLYLSSFVGCGRRVYGWKDETWGDVPICGPVDRILRVRGAQVQIAKVLSGCVDIWHHAMQSSLGIRGAQGFEGNNSGWRGLRG